MSMYIVSVGLRQAQNSPVLEIPITGVCINKVVVCADYKKDAIITALYHFRAKDDRYFLISCDLARKGTVIQYSSKFEEKAALTLEPWPALTPALTVREK